MKLQSLSLMALALELSHPGCSVTSVTNLIFTRLRTAQHRLKLIHEVYRQIYLIIFLDNPSGGAGEDPFKEPGSARSGEGVLRDLRGFWS